MDHVSKLLGIIYFALTGAGVLLLCFSTCLETLLYSTVQSALLLLLFMCYVYVHINVQRCDKVFLQATEQTPLYTYCITSLISAARLNYIFFSACPFQIH